jgi:D-alanine-D-alanine ligase
MDTPAPSPTARPRIAVIGGGANSEHDVSLASAASVARAVDPSRFELVSLTIDRDGGWSEGGEARSFAQAVDVLQSCALAFPVLHGPRGEDGTVAGLLELAGVTYVGSGVRAGAIAMDKWATKLVAGAVGVTTARGALLDHGQTSTTMATPVVVKPVASGSSFGVSLVHDPALLTAAIEAAFQFDDRVLVEELLVGREVDVAVLGRPDGSRIMGAPLEIVVDGGLFDLETKYDGSADFRVPAHLPAGVRAQLERAAVALYNALGCAGVARVDFFVTPDGIVLNEVNTMPGMTDLSQVPRMFAAIGIPYAELVEMLIVDALGTTR